VIRPSPAARTTPVFFFFSGECEVVSTIVDKEMQHPHQCMNFAASQLGRGPIIAKLVVPNGALSRT
jgi:hypothetical protein